MKDLPFLALLLTAGLVLLATSVNHRAWRPWTAFLTWCGTLAYLAWRYHSIAVIDLAPPEQVWWVRFCFWGETVFVVEFWIFLVLSSRSSDHSAEADRHEADSRDGRPLPRVDVFIATYDEDKRILEKSICGALALDWPDFAVHVLDDGRRPWLAEYCATVGANYVTRPDNAGKKAGNHNHALSLTDAPFVAVFDADFVPNRDFLRRTVGFFEDPEIAIVQTPQSFYNKDHFQNSLRMQSVIADDQRFFFRHVMPCRDAWGVAFYVGSSAVLRRAAIAEIGGIVDDMATEDQATSVALLARGHRTLYLDEPLSSGLAPESGLAVIEQRKRWCRGGVQLLFKPFGPVGSGSLPFKERVFFLPTYWLLGYLNPLFFLAEAVGCWYLGYTPFVNVAPFEILIGSFATFAIYSSFLIWVGRGTWLPILSPAFHLFMAFAVLPTALTTLVKPWGKPLLSFLPVTPKGDTAHVGRVHHAALWPLLSGIALLGGGVVSSVFFPLSLRVNPGENLVLSIWTGLIFTQLFVAVLACFAPPHLRKEERFAIVEPIFACNTETCTKHELEDISLDGARVKGRIEGKTVVLDLFGQEFPARVIQANNEETRLVFEGLNDTQRRKLIEELFTSRRPHDVTEAAPLRALISILRMLILGANAPRK